MHPHNPTRPHRIRAGLHLLLGLALAGCSSLPMQKTDDRPAEEIVRERSQARLDALLAKDIETAWGYTTPSYRERTPQPRLYYALMGGSVNWTQARVEKVECAEDACDVITMISYKLKKPPIENTRPLEERWIKVDGEWWIFHRGR